LQNGYNRLLIKSKIQHLDWKMVKSQ